MAGMDQLVDEFLRSEFDDSPTFATSLGVDGYDHLLGDYSAEAYVAKEARYRTWLDRFGRLSDDELTFDEKVDKDLVRSQLRGRLIMSDWKVWKRNPATYLNPGLSGVFRLFLLKLHDEDELTRSACARLEAVPRVLEAGKTNIDATLASPIFVERAKAQCGAGVTYSRTLVPAEAAKPENREALAKSGAIAAAAYEDFGRFLDSLEPTGPFAIGGERYSALLQESEALGYGAREMLERGRAVHADLEAELRKLSVDLGGTDNWVDLVRELSKNHPPTPEAMRESYTEWTERARRFLKDKNLVSFPDGEECLVVPSPPFQRPVQAVASYNPPPAFRPSLLGHFFVPYPPDGVPDEEIAKRLEANSNIDIPTVSVHEAYPGHHWHFAVLQANPRIIRKVLGSSYFIEGWALYTELMMRDEGFYDDPVHELGMLNARIFRAARIVVDTSLHLGEMTFEEAVVFMQDNGLPEPTAKAEVGRYCSWPTQAPSYLTGSLEIERMRDRYLAEERGDLRSFHDTLAGSGMMPIGLAERAAFGD